MELETHKQLAPLINTSNATLKKLQKICAKHDGPKSEISSEIKELLSLLGSVKQRLITDLGQITKTHINPYGK
jgi:hypothetical protein